MIIRLSMPTWLYVIQQHNNLTKFDCLDHFPCFLLHCSILVLPNTVGLSINPVFQAYFTATWANENASGYQVSLELYPQL